MQRRRKSDIGTREDVQIAVVRMPKYYDAENRTTHRSQLNYSEANNLKQCGAGAFTLCCAAPIKPLCLRVVKRLKRFIEVTDDDFNIPGRFRTKPDMAREVNRFEQYVAAAKF